MFEKSEKTPWTDRLYPLRVRTSAIVPTFIRMKEFAGKLSTINYRIPMGVSIIQISKEDHDILMNIAQQ